MPIEPKNIEETIASLKMRRTLKAFEIQIICVNYVKQINMFCDCSFPVGTSKIQGLRNDSILLKNFVKDLDDNLKVQISDFNSINFELKNYTNT